MVKKLFRYKLKMKRGGFREGLIVQYGDRFGEIAPLPGFSKETLAEAELEAKRWLIDNAPPRLPSVRFGINSLERTLQSIKIPLSALGAKKGFSTVKLKLGELSAPEAISFVKKQQGPVLRLDCNRAWSLKEALEFASHFKPDDFDYIEEPLRTIEELIEFSKITRFPVAIDESIGADWSKIPTLKAIVVKPTVVGFIPKIPTPLQCILSSSYESGLGLLHIAHLAKNNLPAGLDTYSAFDEDILMNPIQCSAGEFSWEKTDPIIDFTKLCAL